MTHARTGDVNEDISDRTHEKNSRDGNVCTLSMCKDSWMRDSDARGEVRNWDMTYERRPMGKKNGSMHLPTLPPLSHSHSLSLSLSLSLIYRRLSISISP